MNFIAMAHQCAPDVHITTLMAVVRHESGFDPLAIHINGKKARSIHPKSRDEAVNEARKLLAAGVQFDAGFGQVNVKNWTWLGLTPETVFEPCTNLAAAQRVLVRCYEQAAAAYGRTTHALYAAFSCYNTGNLTAGFENGYVQSVIADAGLKVPALSGITDDGDAETEASNPRSGKPDFTPKSDNLAKVKVSNSPPRPNSPLDSFAKPLPDAFAQPRQDAFAHPLGIFASSMDAQVGTIIVNTMGSQ